MWIIIVGQSCKLFHLLGLNSSVIAASTIIILAYTQPFILHGKLASNIGLKSVYENKSKNENEDEIEKKISQLDDDSTMIQQQSKNVPFEFTKNETRTNILKFTLNPFLSIAYIVIAMVATYFSHFLLIHNILVYLLVKDPSYIQIAAASLSLFFTFTGVYCVAFSRSMTGPSRYVVITDILVFILIIIISIILIISTIIIIIITIIVVMIVIIIAMILYGLPIFFITIILIILFAMFKSN